MTDLKQAILREFSTLPEERYPSVLAYIKFLKYGLDSDAQEIVDRFDQSWERVRSRVKQLNITQEDIDAEIKAVREA